MSKNDHEVIHLKEQLSNLQQLLKVSETILTANDLNQLLNVIMAMTEPIMRSEASSLMLLNDDTQELEFIVATGVASEAIKKTTVKLGQGISGWVAQSGEPLLSNAPYDDPRFDKSYDKRTGFVTKSYICMPLKIGSNIIGTILVLNKMGVGGYSNDDMKLFRSFCNLCAIAIRNHQHKSLESQHNKMTEELEYAHTIQQGFLPKEFPHIDYYDFNAINIPASQVGGDLYDIFQLGDRTIVTIGDVSGKGVSAALFMSRIAADLRFFLETEPDICIAVKKLNDRVCEKSQKGMFLTLCVCILSNNGREALFVNAGHIPPIITKDNTDIEQFEIAPNSPLGIMPGLDFEPQSLTMPDDCNLVFITDGVTDICDKAGLQLKLEGFLNLLEIYKKSGNFMPDLIREVELFGLGASRPDDVTFVVVNCHHLKRSERTTQEVVILSETNEIPFVKDAIAEVCEAIGFSEKDRNLILVAIIEALANVINHAYKSERGNKIHVKIDRESKTIKVTIRDYADAVDLDKVKSRDLDDIRPGGLGVHMINEIMDHFEMCNILGGNEMRLYKTLKN